MTVINIDDRAGMATALRTGASPVDFEVQRASLRTALAAVLPHAGDMAPLDRVRLQYSDRAGLVAVASSGYTVAVAEVHIDHVATLASPTVVDVEARSAREALAVLVPPRDKDARAQWLSESFRITATDEEVTFTEENELLDGRSLTVPRLPHLDEDGQPTIYPDFPRTIAELVESPLAHEVDTALSSTLLATWIKTAKALDSALEVTPRQRNDGTPGLWAVSVGGAVVGAIAPQHPDENHVDNILPAWASRLWRHSQATTHTSRREG